MGCKLVVHFSVGFFIDWSLWNGVVGVHLLSREAQRGMFAFSFFSPHITPDFISHSGSGYSLIALAVDIP